MNNAIKIPETLLLSRGNTQESKDFNKWLFVEVLPRIKHTGGYIYGEERFKDEDELAAYAMQMLEKKVSDRKKM